MLPTGPSCSLNDPIIHISLMKPMPLWPGTYCLPQEFPVHRGLSQNQKALDHMPLLWKKPWRRWFSIHSGCGMPPSLGCLTNIHWLWLVYTQWLVQPCTMPLKYFEANFFNERILLTLSSHLFVLNSIKGGCCMSSSCMYECMGIFNTVYPGSKQKSR